MKNNVYYNGIPIDQVDFKKESLKELALLEKNIAEIKIKLQKAKRDSYDYQFWTIKLYNANKRLEVGIVTLD